jgi:hypothetical protein
MNGPRPANVFQGLATSRPAGTAGYLTQQQALQVGSRFEQRREPLESLEFPPLEYPSDVKRPRS